MKRFIFQLVSIHLFLFFPFFTYAQVVPAFPGSEGGGMYTTGGRGGVVYYVTNLSDDPNTIGSLRWAVNKTGTRIIEFKISGIIELNSVLNINNGNLTIAGQTAPGDGICLKNYMINIVADNVIVRYIRFRLGTDRRAENDAMEGRDHKNIMIDHCSNSWSIDECTSLYDNQNVTVQWSIISESLQNAGVHSKGAHSAGGIIGGNKMSFHHNLYAHHNTRNPRFCGSRNTNEPDSEKVDFRNNVIYNWIENSGYGGEGGSFNIVNNYYKYGPGTNSGVKYKIFEPWGDDGTLAQASGVYGKYYVGGNYVYGSTTVTNDNWEGIIPRYTYLSFTNKVPFKSNTEFSRAPVSTNTATSTFESVLAYAGASLKRDTVDRRIMREVKNGVTTFGTNGLIDSVAQVGGYPTYIYDRNKVFADTDRDGIPNYWELQNGLDPNNSTDGNKLAEGKGGYTNLDIYLAGIVKDITTNQTANAESPVSVVLYGQPENGALSILNEGNLVVSGSTVNKGIKFAITATPNVGYSLASLTVNGIEFTNGESYTVDKGGDIFIVAKMESLSAMPLTTANSFALYPNPVKDVLRIIGTSSDKAKIEIYSSTGILVKALEINGQNHEINVSSLTQGIYILRYTKDNSIKACRFTKE